MESSDASGGGGAGRDRKPPPAFDILAALDFEDSDDEDEGARAAGPVGGSASLDPDADLFGEAPRRLQPAAPARRAVSASQLLHELGILGHGRLAERQASAERPEHAH